MFDLFCMNGRCSVHPCVLELTLGETSSTSKEKIYALEDTMEENHNQNQNCPMDQAVRRMKVKKEYSDHSKSHTYVMACH